MSYKLTWMPDVLLGAGLKVAECENWRERGRADMGTVRGVMCHHTGNQKPGNMPTLAVLINGRPDLPGPLCNLGLGRDGTFYIVAAGRANHAGRGSWAGISTGNGSFIGIEAENGGREEDSWPDDQLVAYRRGVAALLKYIRAGADMCVGHKEYALPVGRKIDPLFSMLDFRIAVDDYLAGKSAPDPIRFADENGNPTLRRGSDGDAVEMLQQRLGIRADGVFGARTEAALRDWQREHELNPDGICGPRTWAKLSDRKATADATIAAGDRRSVGKAGIALIKSFEGCARKVGDGRFEAYPDPGSRTGRPWTIGWGSTGESIGKGTVWTQEQCDDHFAEHIQRYVDEVSRALDGAPTGQNQFDALVSFHYNTGAIRKATLTRLHCEGRFAAAAAEFGKWVRNDGKIMMGLVRRRDAEADLYKLADTSSVAQQSSADSSQRHEQAA